MNKKVYSISILLLLVFFLTACLTVEKKVYTFELKDNNSGTLTIRFVNVMSMKDDTADVSQSDFDEMIMSYIEGNQLEQDYPEALVRSKRLFEEDGVLNGEVIIDFENLKSVGLFQYESKGPYMFNVGSFLDSEAYLSSNGEYGGDVMPVVFWPKSLKTLTLTTYITDPDETTISLLDEYKNWN
ncbi:MAG: hypothetical protein K9G76_03010 [Bacteroidales bacterium]|nr:hypothetical protein [Bacteroidales bacterium]MCF8402764.1 hypothetical protein [Bacteroidales bacterium]